VIPGGGHLRAAILEMSQALHRCGGPCLPCLPAVGERLPSGTLRVEHAGHDQHCAGHCPDDRNQFVRCLHVPSLPAGELYAAAQPFSYTHFISCGYVDFRN